MFLFNWIYAYLFKYMPLALIKIQGGGPFLELILMSIYSVQ